MSLSSINLDSRHLGIGGSDAAAALGVDPYRTPLQLYLEKTTPAAPASRETPQMRWGKLLEPIVRQHYSDVTGRVVRVPPATLFHPEHSFIYAHPDGIAAGAEERLLEIKTSRVADGWGVPGSDQVPESYMLQVQHYLAVTGLRVCDVACLLHGSDFRLYEIYADVELQQLVLTGEAEFWARVVARKPPEPTWSSPHVQQVIAQLYPGTTGEVMHATLQQESWYRVLKEASEHAAIYNSSVEGAKAHLLSEMKEASLLTFSDGKQLRRKLVKRRAYPVEASEYIDARFINQKAETASNNDPLIEPAAA